MREYVVFNQSMSRKVRHFLESMLRKHVDANSNGNEHVLTLRERSESISTEEQEIQDDSLGQELCTRAFDSWKELILRRKERKKQQVEQACVFGAMFRQRLYWLRWREYTSRRRLERGTTVIAQFQTQGDKHQILPLDTSEKGKKLLKVVVFIYRSKAFQQWRSIGRLMRTATESKLEIQSKMARFQCWRSLRRWKAHAKMIKQQSLLRQRAYFFLYYQLMKKSILRLRKYASLKQNDCKNMNVIDSARRNALLRFALTLWSQKRSKRWVLREWRTESLRKQSGSTKYNKTIERISSKYRSNLLYKLFQLWRRHFLGRKIHRAILNVLDKYQLNLVQLAWKQWKDQMARMVDIEQVMQNRRMRLLQQSWKGWKIQTASKQKRENDRRRAVRFYYLSLLKNGFNAFQKTIERRSRLLDLASKKRYEREKRSLTQSFRSWKSFTNAQKDTARKKWIAVDHYELQLVNKVWSRGFCRALEQTRAIACKLDKMRVLSQNRLQAEMFAHWKEIYIFERNRIQLLEVKLVKHLQQKQLASKQQIFVAWAEYRHERFAKRVITAQIYGQWQLKLLQNVFTKWQTGIAAAKWQQILNERANRHYAKNLTKKAFARWIVKNAQMQDYWEQTKSALIHWKLTLERKMFVRLKLYATSKNRQRKRMHGAFEFRQDFFLREGLRHWITAATHLHQQRETRLGNAQAVKTSRIWCKVAAIARHWYHLTLKRKLQTPQTPAVQRKGSTTLLPESLHDHEGWLVQRRAQLHSPAIFGHENVKNVRVKHSNLSEFVMLPRTRPQPRRPVDLLFAGAECLTVQNIENDSSTAMFDLRSKYGFQFEVGVPSAFPVSKDSLHKRNQFMVDQKETYVAAPPILPPSEPSMEGIDDLEQQLLRWKTWKTDWKMFQATIESARADLEEAMMNRNATKETIYAMRVNLDALKKRDLSLRQQWLESKPKIRVLAQQIQHLRASIAA